MCYYYNIRAEKRGSVWQKSPSGQFLHKDQGGRQSTAERVGPQVLVLKCFLNLHLQNPAARSVQPSSSHLLAGRVSPAAEAVPCSQSAGVVQETRDSAAVYCRIYAHLSPFSRTCDVL